MNCGWKRSRKRAVAPWRGKNFAERWAGTVRRECLNHLLIVRPRRLARVLSGFVERYNAHRPHRALALIAPQPRDMADNRDAIGLGCIV